VARVSVAEFEPISMRYEPGEAVNVNAPLGPVVATATGAAVLEYDAIATVTPESPELESKSTTVPDAVATLGAEVGVAVAVGVATGAEVACVGVTVGLETGGVPPPPPPPLQAASAALVTINPARTSFLSIFAFSICSASVKWLC
jgi:hypothetical protein